MTKYLLLAIALLALALGGSGVLLKRSYATNGKQATEITALQDAAKVMQEQARKDRVLITKHAQAKVLLQNKADRLRADLDHSLSANREWADQPIPQEVQDALQP